MTAELAGFRQRVNAGEALIGAFLSIPHPAVASILGRGGFDFVVADAEHGAFTLDSLQACVEALEATPAATIVRVAAGDPVLIKQTLELGVDAVQIPSIRTATEARAAVEAARFAPDGARGIGLGRASGYGVDLSTYLAESNARTAVIAMVEDVEGVANASEIAAVDGLDAIVIGPLDLSASLGVIGDASHPAVSEAIGEVVAAARAAGVSVGTGCRAHEVADLVARGLRILTTFFDVLELSRSARESVRLARAG